MANTTIGNSIVIEGEITSQEAIVVQGTVKGKIETSQSVFVENSATVEADVTGESVEVSGSVTGNIDAQTRVEIKAEGSMVGDVKSPRILIADGARYKGSIDMGQ
ncbi:MAG: polymer-forming cytoskeletal protein [Myxococcota bacterium]|nr:polymer-forming cytoskeletal protein [Myxococcota bacterium]